MVPVLFKRLDVHKIALDRIERDVEITLETLTAFIELFFGVTPPLPSEQKEAARAAAAERFDRFRTTVAQRLYGGRDYLGCFLNDFAANRGQVDPLDFTE